MPEKSRYFEVPVLLIGYNRPEILQKNLAVLSKLRFRKLYISIDGAKEGDTKNEELVLECKKLAEGINFAEEIIHIYPDGNLGCGLGVFSSISEVLKREEFVIILEDDCIPALSFFPFCEELLIKYKNDNKVWMISGHNFSEGYLTNISSYFFSQYFHSGAWAVWRRSWQKLIFDPKHSLSLLDEFRNTSFKTKQVRDFFYKVFSQNLFKTDYDGWDFQFFLRMILSNGLSIIPKKNLVSNIGLHGTHTQGEHFYYNLPVDDKFEIINHPVFVEADNGYDEYHFKNHWLKWGKRKLITRISSRITKILRKLDIGS
jgi:hypothetical protein